MNVLILPNKVKLVDEIHSRMKKNVESSPEVLLQLFQELMRG